MINKFFDWLVKSSANPQAVGLTVKGILTGVVPVAIALLGLTHASVGTDQVNQVVDVAVTLIQDILGVVAVVVTAVGLVRKVVLSLKPAA